MSQHALNGNNNYVRTDSDAYRSLRRHHTYYLNGGDLFLLVGQDLFRIHRYFFERDSDYWAKRFQTGTTASPGSEPIGTADNNAIVVQDVQSDELATFLWVFYNPKYSLYHLSVQEWSTILIVASRWSFREAKAFAVRELEKLSMPDIDRVVLYHDHGVDRNLLLRSYSALADRQEPITLEEGMRLGLETSLMLAKAREIARSGELKVSSPSGLKEEEMQDIIIDLFGVVPSVHAANSPVHIGSTIPPSSSGHKHHSTRIRQPALPSAPPSARSGPLPLPQPSSPVPTNIKSPPAWPAPPAKPSAIPSGRPAPPPKRLPRLEMRTRPVPTQEESMSVQSPPLIEVGVKTEEGKGESRDDSAVPVVVNHLSSPSPPKETPNENTSFTSPSTFSSMFKFGGFGSKKPEETSTTEMDVDVQPPTQIHSPDDNLTPEWSSWMSKPQTAVGTPIEETYAQNFDAIPLAEWDFPPHLTASDIEASNVAASDVAASSVVASDVAASSVVASDVAASSVVASDVAASDVAASEVAASDVAVSNVAASNVAASDVASSDVAASNKAATDVGATDETALGATAQADPVERPHRPPPPPLSIEETQNEDLDEGIQLDSPSSVSSGMSSGLTTEPPSSPRQPIPVTAPTSPLSTSQQDFPNTPSPSRVAHPDNLLSTTQIPGGWGLDDGNDRARAVRGDSSNNPGNEEEPWEDLGHSGRSAAASPPVPPSVEHEERLHSSKVPESQVPTSPRTDVGRTFADSEQASGPGVSPPLHQGRESEPDNRLPLSTDHLSEDAIDGLRDDVSDAWSFDEFHSQIEDDETEDRSFEIDPIDPTSTEVPIQSARDSMSTTLPQPTSASSDNPSSPCPESRTPNAQHKPSTEVPATANPLQTSSDQDTTSQSHATAIPPFPPVTAPIADQDSSPSDMAPSGESVKPPLSGSETQMFKSTGAMTPITPNDSTPATPDATTPTAPQVATPTTPEEGPPTDPEVTTPTTPTTPKPTTPPAPDAVTLSAPNASQQAAGHASLEAGLSTSDKIPPPISTNDTKPTPDEKHISPSPISRTSSSEARFPVDDSEAEDDDERPLAALKKLKASNNAPTVAIPEDEKEEAENEHGTPIDATTSAADTGLSTPVEGDPWLPSPSSAKKKKGKKNKKDVDATNTPLLPAKSEEDEEGLEHVPVIANISGSTPVGATAEDGDFANSEKDDGTKTLHGAPAPAENGGDTEDKPVERTQSDEQTTPITPVAHDSDGWTTQTGGKSGGAKGGVTSRLAGLFGKGKETGNISPGPGPKDEQSETNKEDIGEGDDEVQDDGASEAGQEKPLVGGSGPGASKKKKKNKGKKK